MHLLYHEDTDHAFCQVFFSTTHRRSAFKYWITVLEAAPCLQRFLDHEPFIYLFLHAFSNPLAPGLLDYTIPTMVFPSLVFPFSLSIPIHHTVRPSQSSCHSSSYRLDIVKHLSTRDDTEAHPSFPPFSSSAIHLCFTAPSTPSPSTSPQPPNRLQNNPFRAFTDGFSPPRSPYR